MGLLNAVVPKEELLDSARSYAQRIIANAPLAVQATKQSALQGLYVDEDAIKRIRSATKALRIALEGIDPGDATTTTAAIDACITALDGLGKGLRTAFEQESKLSSRIFRTEDAKEGPRAFVEKRPPVWQAR
jgi:enoyl-CoA hydratase